MMVALTPAQRLQRQRNLAAARRRTAARTDAAAIAGQITGEVLDFLDAQERRDTAQTNLQRKRAAAARNRAAKAAEGAPNPLLFYGVLAAAGVGLLLVLRRKR